MLLIIAVLIIIVVLSCAKNSNKELMRRNREYTAAARKTNAKMERDLVDHYMKHGKSFNDAFESARQDMLAAGYEPCIPREAYKPRHWTATLNSGAKYPETSECPDYDKYDSQAVKNLRSDYRMQCEKKDVKWSKNDEDAYVFSDRLPTTPAQYSVYLDRSIKTHQYESVAIGKYISYPGFGTCEVIDLDFEHSMHTVKVLKTGKIKRIPFGDKNITKL